MTLSKKKIVTPPGQLNLFEWVKQAEELTRQAENPRKGSLDIDTQLRAAISEDIKHAVDPTGREMSRFQVAARMSELVGREITASMLNNYTAEAHDKHNFPCQLLPAFVIGTGGQHRTFEVLSRHAGFFALPGREALRAEIQRIDEDMKNLQAEKAKRRLFLKEIENGGGNG